MPPMHIGKQEMSDKAVKHTALLLHKPNLGSYGMRPVKTDNGYKAEIITSGGTVMHTTCECKTREIAYSYGRKWIGGCRKRYDEEQEKKRKEFEEKYSEIPEITLH